MREIAKTFGVIKSKSWFVLDKNGYAGQLRNTKSSEDN